MFDAFGVSPLMTAQWYEVVKANPNKVKELLAEGHALHTDEFYRDLGRQFQVTQDLRHECPSCGAEVDAVCRTKTGNPAKNHARRGRYPNRRAPGLRRGGLHRRHGSLFGRRVAVALPFSLESNLTVFSWRTQGSLPPGYPVMPIHRRWRYGDVRLPLWQRFLTSKK
ncbi:hypothetical protein SAMN05880568_2817 [Microbacterium sp. RURRCA19A]|nr:hypothetical protein SAMN05880568_2817 [Microbacterium sp. RURRCA19A]